MTNPKPPQPVRTVSASVAKLVLGGVGLVCGLSAAAGLAVGIAPGLVGVDDPLWMFAGFELVALVSAVFAVLIAMGRCQEGRALTAACVGAAIGISAVLQATITNNAIGSIDLTPFVFGRLGLGALALGSACLFAIDSKRSFYRLLIGLAIGSPVAALVAPMAAKRIGISLPDLGAQLASMADGLGPAASLMLWLVGGLLGIVAVSAAGHMVIRAFDSGEPVPAPADTPAAAHPKPISTKSE